MGYDRRGRGRHRLTEGLRALSKTGNTNTLAGNVPPKADLGDLRGLAAGLDGRISAMINGSEEYDGAKAYKDSKVRGFLKLGHAFGISIQSWGYEHLFNLLVCMHTLHAHPDPYTCTLMLDHTKCRPTALCDCLQVSCACIGTMDTPLQICLLGTDH